jgi:hypothetical protein
LTRGTALAAMGLYAATLMLRAGAKRAPGRLRLARLAWTAGCIIFLAHVGCAFHFYHHWSHAAAHENTARRTAAVVGWSWGGGLYFNYIFALLWPMDVALWWRNAAGSRFPAGLDYLVQGFFALMAFNATIVFAIGPVRWPGLAAALLLILLYWRAPRRFLS